jgi:hypothetical protein
MPRKPKTNQSETPNIIQGRDLFQTPNYATELLVPFIPKNTTVIWEPACGNYKISNVLTDHNFEVISTDLKYENANFLTSHALLLKTDCIITNPPFSLKRKFFEKCIEYSRPFALLISADYNLWVIDAIRKYGCEKLIPDHRINFITPTGLNESSGHTSYFHSLWLTRYFNLGKTETFVELTKKMRENI